MPRRVSRRVLGDDYAHGISGQEPAALDSPAERADAIGRCARAAARPPTSSSISTPSTPSRSLIRARTHRPPRAATSVTAPVTAR